MPPLILFMEGYPTIRNVWSALDGQPDYLEIAMNYVVHSISSVFLSLVVNGDADAALGRFSFRFRKNEFFGQFLARLEARIAFCRYSNCLAGPGITTLTLFFVFH